MRSLVSLMALILLLVAGACSSSSDESQTPEPSPVISPSPTPTPTLESPSPEPTVEPATPTPTKPVAVIEEISPNPAYVRETVTFRGNGGHEPGEIKEYRWSIEGHGPFAYKSSFQTASVTDKPGTYTVIFEYKDKNGVWSEPATETLTVLPRPPEAMFTATPNTGSVPLGVHFTDQSSRTVTKWTWDFGDGETSDVQNPVHIYTEGGLYTVSLTVEGPDGSDTEVKENYIEAIEIDFAASPITGYRPLTVQFTDKTKGDIENWGWHFGDGDTSTEQNPVHTYEVTGTYDVTLNVFSKNGGIASETRTGYIKVLEPPPTADFFAHSETYVGHLETFTDRSSGIITDWSWNFGDGTVSNEPNPVHAYSNSGTYTVSLTVTGPGGSDAKQQSIVVKDWE